MTAIAQLDKSVSTALNEGYGTITIRVVVVAKDMAAASAPSKDEIPLDADRDEALPETDKRPIATFLEEPKRGRQCCVFIVNGQRQHAWDNLFITRDLDLKYLRSRMIVVVDCDGLRPEALNQLMQGSRFQFLEGTIYSALESRVIATLKGDPDLRRLEEEAEDEISNLQAGEEAVTAALDQLIEAHHEAAVRIDHGTFQPGEENRGESTNGSLDQTQPVVVDGEKTLGVLATEPVLMLRPDVATVRLKPNEVRRCMVHSRPDSSWKQLETMAVTFDPPVKEMIVTKTPQLTGDEVALKFVEPDGFDEDEYPIEAVMRATAMFKGFPEPRILERRVVINKKKKPPEDERNRKLVELRDDPTYIKVTSRQPIKIVTGGPDVHVKMKWDGKDDLLTGNPPLWTIHVSCESPSVEPQTFHTRPVNGRFEILIQASPGLNAGEQLKIDVEAVGPTKTLSTAFLADVMDPPTPRKISAKAPGGAQRRPPYELKYVTKDKWHIATNWGRNWTGEDVGSFDPPTHTQPLIIYINTETDLVTTYRDSLLEKRLLENTIKQRVNKYTAHVAFHLYQMYQKQKEVQSQPGGSAAAPTEEQMRDEIQRVARTMLKLMDMM